MDFVALRCIGDCVVETRRCCVPCVSSAHRDSAQEKGAAPRPWPPGQLCCCSNPSLDRPCHECVRISLCTRDGGWVVGVVKREGGWQGPRPAMPLWRRGDRGV